MREPELQVGLAEAADALARVPNRGLDLLDALDQVPKGLIAERQHHLFLVLEIEIQRGRRYADPVRDPADGRGLVAQFQEQLFGGLKDFLATGMPLAALFPARRHGCRKCVHGFSCPP